MSNFFRRAAEVFKGADSAGREREAAVQQEKKELTQLEGQLQSVEENAGVSGTHHDNSHIAVLEEQIRERRARLAQLESKDNN